MFSQTLGTVVSHFFDDAIPSVTFEYKTRLEAEVAFIKGKTFNDRNLALSYIPDPPAFEKPVNIDEQELAAENGGGGDVKTMSSPKVTIKSEPEDVRAIIKREEEELDFDDDEDEDNVSVVTDRHKSSASSFDENSLLGEEVSQS